VIGSGDQPGPEVLERGTLMIRHSTNVWLAVLAAGIGAVAAAQQTEPAKPRLELSAQEWNFGEVWQGLPVKHEVKVTNAGTAPLTITVTSSCGCTVPTPPKSPLDPGESGTMTISYDAAHRRGPANQTLTIATNDPERATVSFVVRGEVKPTYDVTPVDVLNFARLYQDSQESRALQIINRYSGKMSLQLKEGLETPGFSVELKELEPGRRYELSARTRPPLAAGVVRRDVLLETGLEVMPEIRVLIAATVEAPITVLPDKLVWPRNLVSPIDKVLRVSYAPGHPVRVVEAHASDPAITVTIHDVPPTPRTAQPGGEKPQTQPAPDEPMQEIVVRLPATTPAPGADLAAIELRTDSKDPAYEKITIAVHIAGPAEGTAAPHAAPTTQPTPTSAPAPTTP
jgi:hypothetical protein